VTRDIPSTCGPYALRQGEAKVNANIIDTLNDAGLIIIAKANLSVSSNLPLFFATPSLGARDGRRSYRSTLL
jgi:hypothetical protein